MKSFENFEFLLEKWFTFQNENFGMWQTIRLKRNLNPRFRETRI
jgi:hypothetical protein